ncbi:MAG: hypothetical protein ACOCUS_03350 [Polyangiales bacterium]
MPNATDKKNFHVPLDGKLYRELREEAERSELPATVIAREAIESYLYERRRAALHDEMAAYARDVAGTADDLDEELEAAAVEHLTDEGEG